MGEATDSNIDSRESETVPRVPGRGLTREGKYHYLTALPSIDGRHSGGDLSDGLSYLVAEVRKHWTGPPAPPVRMLPTHSPRPNCPPLQTSCASRWAWRRNASPPSGTTSAKHLTW